MGNKHTGVRAASKNSIEIVFWYRDERCKERVKKEPTATNLKKYANFRGAILDAIEDGTFDYQATFPTSKNAKKYKPSAANITIAKYLMGWIEEVKATLHTSTYTTHKRAIKGILTREFGHLTLDEITWLDVRDWSKKSTVSFKTQKNYISVLRSALNEAVEDGILNDNPLFGKNLKNWDKKFDVIGDDDVLHPFSEVERNAIFEQCNGQIGNYVITQIWTGMRPSEARALTWDDIDWLNGYIKVNKGLAEGVARPEKPKTNAGVRRIKILPAAMQALQDQKQYTYLQNNRVFNNPRTHDTLWGRSFIKTYWKRLLKLAGVSYRNPYQMRHTYATMMIMAGEPLFWVSQQMGHEKASFTIDTYFEFLPQDMPDAGNLAVAKWGGNNNKALQKIG